MTTEITLKNGKQLDTKLSWKVGKSIKTYLGHKHTVTIPLHKIKQIKYKTKLIWTRRE